MTQPPSDHLEVEWQFEIDDLGAARRWLQASVVSGYLVSPGPVKELNDTYFDTEDWRVHRAGFTCRVRNKSDGPELTLKTMADSAGGMRSRREINEPIQDMTAAALMRAPGQCGELLRLTVGSHPLRPIFSLRTHRETFSLTDGEGEIAEIALDDVAILPGDEQPPVRSSRIEVEVDERAVERAQRFVELTVATLGLVAARLSKFQLGLAAAGLATPGPERPQFGPDRPTDSMTTAEAAFAIMRKQYEAFLANELSTRLGEDIEGLHDMRVATRRLRAAMGAFRPYLSPRIEKYRLQFGWIAAALGDVRDLDVQLERMREWRTSFSPEQADALAAVESILVERRNAARKRMLAAMDSRRYGSLTERFAAVLRRGPARSFAPGRAPILGEAPDLLERRYRRLRRDGDQINPTSPPTAYHALRIEAKKLRYALEFVGPLYGRPAVEFSERVTALQDVLGLHQDAEVAGATLHEMALAYRKRLGPETMLVMGAVSERYRADGARLRAKFPSVYKPLGGKEWRKLRKSIEARRPGAPKPIAPRAVSPMRTAVASDQS